MLPGFLAVKVPSLLQYCERNTSLKNQSFEEFTFVPVSLMSRKISDIVGCFICEIWVCCWKRMDLQFGLVQSLSCLTLCWLRGLQHSRLPCPPPTPEAYSWILSNLVWTLAPSSIWVNSRWDILLHVISVPSAEYLGSHICQKIRT